MRILDRYILKSVLNIFLSCIFIFFFMYIIIDLFSNLEIILKQHVILGMLKKYYLSYLPIMFVQVAPIASLLATLYTFGKLNHNNEIIAMRSSGLSIFQITRSVILFGLIVSLLVFWVNNKFVPQSLFLTQKIRERMETGNKKIQEKENEVMNNLSMYGMKNRLFFVNRFYVSTSTMEGIIILEHDEKQDITKKIVADKGVYKDGVWRFFRSITYLVDENGQILQEPHYADEEIMTIPETPNEFLNQRQRPEYMTIEQLDDYIWKLSRSGATTVIRNLKVNLYQRFTSPFTTIIMIFIGIPFSLIIRKRATGLSSIGLSILVGFLYHVLDAVSIALGKAGILTPLLAVSLSHIVAFTSALFFIKMLP